MSDKAGGRAIGIDLGTTYSCVAYWKDDRVEIIPNDQGNRITPSYVAFTDNECLVGDAAFNQVALNAVNTIFDAKRIIGRKFSDESLQRDMKLWPFKVISSSDDRPRILVTHNGEEKEFAAEEISAMVLTKMKDIAEKYIGSVVKNAVVTVPAYFNQSQRQATVDAAKIAGLNVLSIINEPTAAAIAYGLQNSPRMKKKRSVLVFDFGGGTFDVAILTIKKNNFEVKAIAGDTHLGGEDFDNRMVHHYIEEFKKKYNKDMRGNPRSVRRLKTVCERAKRILSSVSETRIDIDALFEGIDFSAKITRPKFEDLNSDLFTKCMETVESCLKDAKMTKKDVDDIVLVGGSSRIPKVKQLLQQLLNRKVLWGSINPDEAVAYGAAVQAAKLTSRGNEKIRNLVLVEVTPLSLGIGTSSDVMYFVIPRNTVIPTRRESKGFTTICDNQTEASFPIYEGERIRANENKFLGRIVVTDIEMALRGVPRIDFYFDLQASGILKVSAKNRLSGKEVSITVISGGLSGQEREVMIEEAIKNKEEDEKRVKRSNARTALSMYACLMRDKMRQEINVSFDKKKKAEDALEKALQRLDEEKEFAEVFEYEEMTKELKLSMGDLE